MGATPDLYQLLAYTTALDLPEGMLIYCLDADEPDGDSRSSSTLGANFADQMPPATALPAGNASVSSVRVRHTGTLLHTYALNLSGTPDDVGENMTALADWIADRVAAASSAATPVVLTA